MLRTIVNLMQVDAGFDRSRLITFSLDLPNATYPEASQVHGFYQRLQEQLAAIPGVQGATRMSGLPPDRRVDANDTDIDGYTSPPEGPFENVDYYQTVGDGYFETMGIPVLEGRGFRPGDAQGPPVVVINETMARMFWKDRPALGGRVRPSMGQSPPWMTIVGVVKDVKQGGVDQRTGTELYFHDGNLLAHLDRVPGNMNFALRTPLPLETLAPSIEAAVRGADAALPIIKLRAVEDVFRESLSRPRLLANLLGVFAGLALVLAAVGTYGVLSYMVGERRREIGIRMALGAARGNVLASVMRQGMTLTAIGAAAGIAGALALTRLMESLLFGVQPGDPLTLAGVVLTITIIAFIACLVPAQRAMRVDPVVVLRDE
jgi:predicted permease